MNSKGPNHIVKAGLALAILLVVCGFSWAQSKDEKKEDKKSTPPAKSAPHPARPAAPAASTRPEGGGVSGGGRPPSTAGESRGQAPGGSSATNSGGNSGGTPGGRPSNTYGGNAGGTPGGRPTNAAGGNAGGAPGGRPNNTLGGNSGGAPGGRPTNAANGNPGARPGGRPNSAFSAPPRTVTSKGGFVGKVAPNGRITSIRGNGIVINHGANGGRTVITTRPDHTRLVSIGPGRGFVDRPIVRNGRPYISRTYVVNGRSFARVYVGFGYRGGIYYHYVPAFYFAPAFYGWAFRPWGLRVAFNWGWGPWFGFYGYYFNPYPVYVDSGQWLTDYVLSQNLQAAYDAGYAAGQQGQGGAPPHPPDQSSYAPLSPELKQAIADEVRAQLAAESAAAARPQAQAAPTGDQAPDALDPKFRTFVVSTPLVEQLPNGAECSLASGDILTRIDDAPDANSNVRVLVSSSQANDCPSGSQLAVGLQDLQDMHNAFHEQVDSGLGQLSQNQGKNGIPAGPAGNPTPYADGTAQPDPNAQASLQQQQQGATQTEQDVQGSIQ